jgi:hypothetical protein
MNDDEVQRARVVVEKRADRLAEALDALQRCSGRNEWNMAAARMKAVRVQLRAEQVAARRAGAKEEQDG